MHILFLPIRVINSMSIKRAEFYQFRSVVFCYGVTPLKCGDINDMIFVVNFIEITTMKKFWKSVNIILSNLWTNV